MKAASIQLTVFLSICSFFFLFPQKAVSSVKSSPSLSTLPKTIKANHDKLFPTNKLIIPKSVSPKSSSFISSFKKSPLIFYIIIIFLSFFIYFCCRICSYKMLSCLLFERLQFFIKMPFGCYPPFMNEEAINNFFSRFYYGSPKIEEASYAMTINWLIMVYEQSSKLGLTRNKDLQKFKNKLLEASISFLFDKEYKAIDLIVKDASMTESVKNLFQKFTEDLDLVRNLSNNVLFCSVCEHYIKERQRALLSECRQTILKSLYDFFFKIYQDNRNGKIRTCIFELFYKQLDNKDHFEEAFQLLLGSRSGNYKWNKDYNKDKDLSIIIVYLKSMSANEISCSITSVFRIITMWDRANEYIQKVLVNKLEDFLKKGLEDSNFNLLLGLLKYELYFHRQNMPIYILEDICGSDDNAFIQIINETFTKDNAWSQFLAIYLLCARVGLATKWDSAIEKDKNDRIKWAKIILDGVNFENLFSAILKIEDCYLLMDFSFPLFHFSTSVAKIATVNPSVKDKLENLFNEEFKILLRELKDRSDVSSHYSDRIGYFLDDCKTLLEKPFEL